MSTDNEHINSAIRRAAGITVPDSPSPQPEVNQHVNEALRQAKGSEEPPFQTGQAGETAGAPAAPKAPRGNAGNGARRKTVPAKPTMNQIIRRAAGRGSASKNPFGDIA